MLQIPAGNLSDRIGRRRVIVGGLCCFVLGSVAAALSTSIEVLIVGRLLQGAGAIAAALMALAADIISEEHRTKAMAAFGISIGGAFALGIVIGPVIYGLLGFAGVFWATACLGLIAIAIVLGPVPQSHNYVFHRQYGSQTSRIREVLNQPELRRAYAGVFALHMILTASFFALPLLLRDYALLEGPAHWQVYLPAFLVAIAIMLPFLKRAHRPGFTRRLLLGAVALLTIIELSFAKFGVSAMWIGLHLVVFFACFNLIEASLPTLITRTAPVDARGTALGVFSSSQFLGAFCGGLMGGWAMGAFGLHSIFLVNAIVAALWLAAITAMREPPSLLTRVVKLGRIATEGATTLGTAFTAIAGVSEAVVVAEEGSAYLRVDPERLDTEALQQLLSIHAVSKNI